MKFKNYVLCFILLMILASGFSLNAQNYNKGIGIYPGSPKENFSPSMKIDKKNYRNIALLKPVYSSGSYDFNLTAQLITDGIIETKMPGWIVTTTSNGILPRNEREYFIDRHPESRKIFEGNKFWIQIELAGNSVIPEVNGFKFSGSISTDTVDSENKSWQITVNGSNDGKEWKVLGTLTDNKPLGDSLAGHPANYRRFNKILGLDESVGFKFYRAEFSSPFIQTWRIPEFILTNNGTPDRVGGPYNFVSAWKSIGSQKEWAYVDLGAECSFNKIKLYWLKRASAGAIQVSDNTKEWKNISTLPDNPSLTDEIKLAMPVDGRYVRLELEKAASEQDGYVLSEMEIYGTGAAYAVAHAPADIQKDGTLPLSGGAWKLQRSALQGSMPVKDNLETCSKVGFNDSDWVTATVPGTVLTSYLNAGMLPDPNYSDNQFLISDSYFYSDFIYRDEFIVPQSYTGKRIFLNFDGINWKAIIYLNGKKLGRIEGAFTRGKFDVTDNMISGRKNALVVYILKNDAPGFVKEPTFQNHDVNGGELGLDNPTFHTSVGWDWFPSIRGRNIGIWNEVYLSTSRDVTIEDQFITSKLPLPDTNYADLKIQVTLKNHSTEAVSGNLKGKVGEVKFELPVSLSASELKTITLDPSTLSALHLNNPKLWWPNGYGKQNLYDVNLEFISSNGKISDSKELKTGIREMSYSEDGGVLKIWVNGKRFIARGGNWGFSESDLRYRSREYDIAIRYHKEMNLNMLRNWVGQTGDDEFYEACDRYGIMVWQDFWLANPGDGPNPKDNKLFMQNAEDYVKRLRNHPSIALYCGRNEGDPPELLDKALREMLSSLTPEVHYISNSLRPLVSGGGPYNAMPVKFYFDERATPKLHSELGLPIPVSVDSFRKMIPDSASWPINRLWSIHDFCLESAQEGAGYIKMMNENFGSINNQRDWLTYSQWISYQGCRAILEAQGKNRMGVLIWMTHPAWPSFVYQTYDYYFEPTGAYFGCKKGGEPLHIQWNAFTDSVEVVNYSSPAGKGLTATIEILNSDGSVKLKKQFDADCSIDQVNHICKLEKPAGLSSVYFIRLKLEKNKELVSENFYWNGLEDGNIQAISRLPKIKLDVYTKAVKKDGKWFLSAELINNTKTPALMVKLKVIGAKDKERMLPVIFSDNYVSLMPGEKRIIKLEIDNSDTRGDKPEVVTEGINIK